MSSKVPLALMVKDVPSFALDVPPVSWNPRPSPTKHTGVGMLAGP